LNFFIDLKFILMWIFYLCLKDNFRVILWSLKVENWGLDRGEIRAVFVLFCLFSERTWDPIYASFNLEFRLIFRDLGIFCEFLALNISEWLWEVDLLCCVFEKVEYCECNSIFHAFGLILAFEKEQKCCKFRSLEMIQMSYRLGSLEMKQMSYIFVVLILQMAYIFCH
jgi:hypothetical protein